MAWCVGTNYILEPRVGDNDSDDLIIYVVVVGTWLQKYLTMKNNWLPCKDY